SGVFRHLTRAHQCGTIVVQAGPASEKDPWMADAQRLFRRMQRTKSGWGWSDFDTLYRGFGFTARDVGPHTVYAHPSYPELRTAVARHRHLPPGYAQRAVTLIRRLQQLEAQESENGDD